MVAVLLLPTATLAEGHGAVSMTSKNIDMALGKCCICNIEMQSESEFVSRLCA